MRDELRLLNALIGMSMPGGGWPDHLHRLGFKLTAMQRDVTLDLDGRRRTVTPEAVFQSVEENACFVVEAKSSSFDHDQAKRYWHLSVLDLVAHGAAVETSDLDEAICAPSYFCQAIHTGSLSAELQAFNDEVGAQLPLVDYTNHRFQLRIDRIRHPQLQDDFEGGIWFTEAYWPTSYIPFDAESPIQDYRGRVLAELLALLVNPDVEVFDAKSLASGHQAAGTDGCVPYFDAAGTNHQRQIAGKIRKVVNEFRVHYLREYVEELHNPRRWHRTRSVSTPAAMRALNERKTEYLHLARQGLPLPKELQAERLTDQAAIDFGE